MVETIFTVRLTSQGIDQLKTALRGLGTDGARALKEIERGAVPASRGLGNLVGPAGLARAELQGLAAQAGPLGRLAGILGPGGLIAAAGLVLGGGLAVAAKRAADAIAEIGDAAERARIDPATYEKIAATFVVVGQSAEGLEGALGIFSRKLGEAQEGAREATADFARLGVSIRNQDGSFRSTEDVLLDVAEGLAKLPTEAQRAAASADLFGRSSRALGTILGQGEDAVRGMFAEAEKLGLLYGGDLIAKSQELSDEFDRQARILDVTLKKAFVGAADDVARLTQSFVDSLPRIIEFIERVGVALGLLNEPVEVQIEAKRTELVAALGRTQTVVLPRDPGAPIRAADDEAAAQRLVASGETPEVQAIRAEIAALDAVLVARRKLIENAKRPVDPAGDGTDTTLPPGGGGAKPTDALADAIAKTREQTAALQDATLVLEAQRDAIALLGGETAETRAGQEQYTRQLELYAIAARDAEGVTQAEREAIEAALGPLLDATVARNKAAEAVARLKEEQDEEARTTTQAAEELRAFGIQTAETFGEAVASIGQGTDALRDFGIQLAKIAAQGILFGEGPLGGFFGDLFGGNVLDLFSARGNAFDRGRVIPFAQGGIVDRPTLFGFGGGRLGVMGERGPETILPLARGADGVLGVQATGGGGGSTVINYAPVIDARGASVEAVARLEQALARDRASFEARVVGTLRVASRSRVRFG